MQAPVGASGSRADPEPGGFSYDARVASVTVLGLGKIRVDDAMGMK